MMDFPVIYWLRNDLRLMDNPALRYAIASNKPVFFVYIVDDTNIVWAPGAASSWWLHYSLRALQAELAKFNAQLYLFKGCPQDVLR